MVGYEATYEVSDAGRVRRLPGYVHSPRSRNGLRRVGARVMRGAVQHGYQCVTLCQQGRTHSYKVHALVCAAFIGPRPTNYDVNHKDGQKRNNRLANLEYATEAYNNQHAYDVCGKKMPRGEANHAAKLTQDDIRQIRALRASGLLLREIGARFNICMQHVAQITSGKSWTHVQ